MGEDDKTQTEGYRDHMEWPAAEEEWREALNQLLVKVSELFAQVKAHEARLKTLERACLEVVPTEEMTVETCPDQEPEQTIEERARAVGADYGKLRRFYSEEELRRLLTRDGPPRPSGDE